MIKNIILGFIVFLGIPFICVGIIAAFAINGYRMGKSIYSIVIGALGSKY